MTTSTSPEVMRELARVERRLNQRIDDAHGRISRLYDGAWWIVGASIVGATVGVVMGMALSG